jgi:hypothetical protein
MFPDFKIREGPDVGNPARELLCGEVSVVVRVEQGFSNFRQSRTASKAVGAQSDHRKIPHAQKCMQVNRRNIIPMAKVTITVFFYTLI